jgi:peptide/nickel transport system substrate-binding protein
VLANTGYALAAGSQTEGSWTVADGFALEQVIKDQITRRVALKRLTAGGAALTLPGVLAACGGSSSSSKTLTKGGSAPASEQEIELIKWGIAGDVQNVFLPSSADIPTIYVTNAALESLLAIDDNGRLIPSVAESWNQPDATTYVYNLRQGVKFWNGDPVTADDVVWTLQYQTDPKNASQLNTYFSSIKSIEATGPMQVTIKLVAPEATFRWIPGTYFAQIVQKKFYEAHKKSIGTPGVLTMGTGPFKFTKLVPGSEVVLERNDLYWGTKPRVKKLIITPIPDDSARLLAMRSGQIDGAGLYSVPVSQAAQWSSIGDVHVNYQTSLQVGVFGMNNQRPPWNDVHVRRAVAWCTDGAGLVKGLWGGYGQPANAMPPPALWKGLLPDDEVKRRYAALTTYSLDLAKAKAELAKSAHPKGFSATMVYANTDTQLGNATQALAANLAKIGIKLNVKEIPVDQWNAMLVGPKSAIDSIAATLGADYNDPGENIYLNFQSKFATNGEYNFVNIKNAQLDAMLDHAHALNATDPKRYDALFAIMEFVAQQVPMVYVWWNDTAQALKSKYVFEGLNPWTWIQPWASRIKVAA